jgi:hypothetical protein
VAAEGGGVYLANSTARISNTTLTDNGADTGSAIYVNATSMLTLEHVTLVENWGNGAALTTLGPFSILNSILTGNQPDDYAVSGPATELGNNQLSGDPGLAPLGDYGGPTRSMPPLVGSPALEGGQLVSPPPPARDQRNNYRTLGLAPDLGAVETFSLAQLGLPSADGDLIPDELEGPGKPFSHLDPDTDDSTVDSDLDGFTDAQEFYLFTDIFDPSSAFKIEAIQLLDGGHGNRLLYFRFPSIPGNVYQLEIDEDLGFSNPEAVLINAFTYNQDDFVLLSGSNQVIRLKSFGLPAATE